ncbi:MAG: VWA domain-containing protein [Gemmataceae bacterium]|nr:VWA domain-containing protein [Gemmataceae bacterium]MCI0738261.1 VWA domain-containing protein [Gemmataceae bacterium]
MPDNPAPSPAWKNQGADPAKKDNPAVPAWKQEAGAAAPGGAHAWQTQSTAPPATPKPRSKVTKVVFALGLLGVLLGAVVVVILWLRPPQKACWIVLGASYDDNLSIPHNALGWKTLKDLAGTGIAQAYPSGDPVEVQGQKSWNDQWGKLKAFKEETALVYLAFHGGADSKGDAYLFLNDARGQERMYVKDIIAQLPKQWPNKNVVLILEPGPFAAHWTSGMMQNHFVRDLKKLKSEIEKSRNLFVLCGCDEGQVSWPSEELQRTVFGHHVIVGLSGAADGGGEGRVTLHELYSYLKNNVDAWALANRGTGQSPILLGDLELAKSLELAQIDNPNAESSVPSTKQFTPPAGLAGDWDACEKLRNQIPSPAAYTPHLWRRYNDLLLRVEQLERAGDPTGKVSKLKGELLTLAADIEGNARVAVKAADGTLALPLAGALGLSARKANFELTRTDVTRFFERLWSADDAEQRKKLLDEWLVKTKAAEELRGDLGKVLYADLCRELLTHVSESNTIGPSDLGPALKGDCTARAVARLLEEQFKLPRPAELHYLVMLLEDLDPKTPPSVADLQLALKVRLFAEEAALGRFEAGVHPYSELVYPWIRKLVEDADTERGLGENWLFGAGEAHWKTARDLLNSALAKYQMAIDDAKIVRNAFSMRDLVLADLSYYAQWLAQKRLPRAPEPLQQWQQWQGQVERLAKRVGDLSWCLEQLDFQGPKFGKDRISDPRNPEGLSPRKLLEKLTADIHRDYKDPQTGLSNRFRTEWESYHKRQDHLPANWHELEAFLSVPLIDKGAARMHLLTISRSLSKKMQEGHANFSKADQESPERTASVKVQTQLALTVLVRDAKDGHALADVDKSLPSSDEIDKIGSRIGKHWKQLTDEVIQDLPASMQSQSLSEAAAKLREAEFSCRLLPGGAKLSFNPFGPPEGMRHLRQHDLLLWQAKRVVEDHWFGEGEPRVPYYEPVAQAYAKMAKELAAIGAGNETIAAGRKKQADQFLNDKVKVAGMQVTGQKQGHWTSELSFPLSWGVQGEKGVPAGVPMVWLQLPDGSPVNAKESLGRTALERWQPSEGGPAKYLLQKSAGKNEDTKQAKVMLSALYRGQKIDTPIQIDFWNPDTIVRHIPPEKAGVAFRMAKDFNYGAICFVLDCSGSMATKVNGRERYLHAMDALDTTLQNVPDNTFVSLMYFVSEKELVGGTKRFKTKYKLLRDPEEWKKRDRDDLMAAVRKLKFDEYSPLAQAMIEARNRGFPKDTVYQGPKLIVLLTDGDDNYSFDETYVDPKKTNAADLETYATKVREHIVKAFRDQGVDLHVVCFNDPEASEQQGAETARAKLQFEKAIEALPPGAPPAGSFRIQPDPGNLARDLELAIRPVLRLQRGSVAVKKEGVFGRFGEALEWQPLKPGTYTASLRGRDPQDFNVAPGDFMILTLQRQDRNYIFERTLLHQEESDKKIASKSKDSWEASVLQNQVSPKGDLVRQLVVLEDAPVAGKGERQILQKQPGFLWLEMKPKEPKDTRAVELVEWRRDFTYAAPAVSVQARGWPFPGGRPASPDLRIWWVNEAFPESPRFSASLQRKPAKQLFENFVSAGQRTVGKSALQIEDVAFEDHEVPLGGGKLGKRACLVIRLNHTSGAPVFVQLRVPGDRSVGVRSIGEEHRYFAGANKYTALFWDLQSADKDNFSFHVISLVDFQAAIGEPVSFDLPPPTAQQGPTRVPIADEP